jgi:hypothetical protein
VWLGLTLALLLAVGAVVMSVAKLTSPTPSATTRTVMAPPPPAPTYNPQQVTAAKKEACDASAVADKSIIASQTNFFDAARDRQSPQYRPALANFQLVLMLETEYMQRHLAPATPMDVAVATNDYIDALVVLADANTRELSDHDAQPFVVAVRNAGKRLSRVCK